MNCCKNPNHTLECIYTDKIDIAPDRHYILKCLNCNTIYKDNITLINFNYRLIKVDKIRKLICKIFGHKKAIPTLFYTYNTLTGLKVDAKYEKINFICTRCGKNHGDFIKFNRLNILKQWLKK